MADKYQQPKILPKNVSVNMQSRSDYSQILEVINERSVKISINLFPIMFSDEPSAPF